MPPLQKAPNFWSSITTALSEPRFPFIVHRKTIRAKEQPLPNKIKIFLRSISYGRKKTALMSRKTV